MSSPQPAQPVPPPPAPPKARASLWPLTLMVIAVVLGLIVAFTILALRAIDGASRLIDTPARLTASLASAFQPQITVNTLLLSTIGEMHSRPKLVVLTTQVNVEVEKASNTTWAGINFGTTVVRVRARENRVQYYVPLKDLQTSDFVYDEPQQKLFVRVPRPRMDEEVVDVQSNPAKIDIQTANGWAKLDAFSGAPLREAARHELRPAVLAAGRHNMLQNEAERRGKDDLYALLRPIADALRPGVTLDIEFVPVR